MNWVVFFVLLGFGLGNLVGLGLWLNEYIHESHKTVWYKDGKFWLWFFYLLVVGIAYAVIKLIQYIAGLIRK